jgi:hypothetical protein
MAVNQAQVDSIISSASAEDPEIQLLKLRDEVELLKTSIKRLLIDIRERMNDAENPLVAALKGQPVDMVGSRHNPTPMDNYVDDYDDELDVENDDDDDQENGKKMDDDDFMSIDSGDAGSGAVSSVSSAVSSLSAEKDMLESLRNQLFSSPGSYGGGGAPASKPKKRQKVKIQRVYSLFEWTSANVKRYGHDRVDLMLESYKEMGHIADDHCKQVKDISRLMAPSIGEVHEIRADEFVLALYELNRILQPDDPALDRDMIDVLIDRKKDSFGDDRVEESNSLYESEDETDSNFEYVPSQD